MPPRSNIFYLTALIILVSSVVFSQSAKKDNEWKQWHFLIGEWVGEGGGKPGQATGNFTFDFDLQKKILIRKSVANFSATKEKPAFSHNDLMIIYKEPSSSTEAMYFDSEGKVIKYTVKFSDDLNSVIFVSVPVANEPIYRLSYIKVNNQKLNFKFEIARQETPGSFSTYLEATVHRK
ncbi:MAG: hypothetical protein P4L45_14830 [Ignavibacteriaceae bacterium]|nr:hypothetical protein [Ignavibacteriaceae bacterium]